MKQSMPNLIEKRLYRKIKCESLNDIRDKLRQSKNLISTSSQNAIQSDRISEDKHKKSHNFLEDLLERKFGQSNYTFNSLIFKRNSQSRSIGRSTSKESFEYNLSALEVLLEPQRKKTKLNKNDNNESKSNIQKASSKNDNIDKIVILDLKNKMNENYSAAYSYQNLNEERKTSKTILNLDEKYENINCHNNNFYNKEIISNVKENKNKEFISQKNNEDRRSKTKIENIIPNDNKIFEDEEDIDLLDFSGNEAQRAQRAKNSSINHVKFPKMKLDFQKIKTSEIPADSKNSEAQTLLPNSPSENRITIVNEAAPINKLNLNSKPKIKGSLCYKNIVTQNSNLKITQNSKLSKNLIFNNYNGAKTRLSYKNLNFQGKFLHHSENETNSCKQNHEKFINRMNSKNNTYINNITINRNTIENKDTSNIENIRVKDQHGNTINLNLNLNVKFDLNLNNSGIGNKDDALLNKLKKSRENILRKTVAIQIDKQNKENKSLHLNLKSKNFSYRTNSITINKTSNILYHSNSINKNNKKIDFIKEIKIKNKNNLQVNNGNKTERVLDSTKNNNLTRNSLYPKISSKDNNTSRNKSNGYETKNPEIIRTRKMTFMDIIVNNSKNTLNKDFKTKADIRSKIIEENNISKYINTNTKILPELNSIKENKSPVLNSLQMNNDSKKDTDYKKLCEVHKGNLTERIVKNNHIKSKFNQNNFHNLENMNVKVDSIGYAHKYYKSKNCLKDCKAAENLKSRTGNLTDRNILRNSKAILNFNNNN